MTAFDKEMPDDIVPMRHPYGSITDGDWMCGRCGGTITGCSLCAGEKRFLVRAPKNASQWRDR